MTSDEHALSRRGFLRTAAAAAGVTAMGAAASAQEEPKLPKRRIPGTDLDVSAIGYGTEFLADRSIVDYLIGKGLNFIDTAPLYQEGEADRKLAPVLADHPGQIVLSTKMGRTAAVDGTTTKAEFLAEFEGSCERLQVSSADILYLHDCRQPEKVNSPGAYEAFRELRDAGRVRYFGMSTHLAQEACVRKATELGWFDVLMVAWSFFSPASLTDALQAAADAGMGIIPIKVARGLTEGEDWFTRATEEQRQVLGTFDGSLYQRSIRWTLKHDFVGGVIMSVSNYDQIDENVAAAATPATQADADALSRYADAMSAHLCRGCGTCLQACPNQVAIPDILRFRAYYRAYKQVYPAMAFYRRLPEQETYAACGRCGSCQAACPCNLSIPDYLEDAHRLMA